MEKYKWYGHFNGDDSFTVTRADTPRHWYNYLFNDEYVTFTSQVGYGEGFAQDDMGRRLMPVSNRNIFVCDGDRRFSLFALPIDYGYENYSCTHKNGSSTVSLVYDGIASSVRIFVPNSGKHEIWSVTLRNVSDTAKSVKLISYARCELDGRYRPQGYNLGKGGFFGDKNAVYAHVYSEFYSKRCVNVWGFMSSSEKPAAFDSRRNAFIGTYGDEQHPLAITSGTLCTNSECNSEKLCLALENAVTLGAGEEKTVVYTVGVALTKDEIISYSKEEAESGYAAMEAKYRDILSGVKIKTPWVHFDSLINGWMKYAADMGSYYARVRHNGYRDMTSDTECFACVNPQIAWERIKRVLSYQYSNGYAPRTIIDGEIKDRKFADNTVWMTSAAATIVKELGKPELLNESVKFNDGTEAPVYEHLKRSVEFLFNFTGHHGLVRIWGGDWNDCVNYAGLAEKGVSVWLSIAWCRAAMIFVELAKALGKTEDASLVSSQRAEMVERIEKYGWDGDYYLYAITDDGIKMGSHENDEGKIFLISQLWSVFAGLDKDRTARAMKKVEEILECPLGTRLAYPAYSYQRDYIGSMAEKEPGVQDNGGIYLHPSAWKLAAESILGNAGKVEEGLRKMLPYDDTYADKCGEPYAMFNSYFAPETGYRAGTPGQSWRTAASSWLLKSTVEYIFGLHPEFGGLKIKPCLPPSWESCSITKVFRGCVCDITYSGGGSAAEYIEADGIRLDTDIINTEGKKHMNIFVSMKKEENK